MLDWLCENFVCNRSGINRILILNKWQNFLPHRCKSYRVNQILRQKDGKYRNLHAVQPPSSQISRKKPAPVQNA